MLALRVALVVVLAVVLIEGAPALNEESSGDVGMPADKRGHLKGRMVRATFRSKDRYDEGHGHGDHHDDHEHDDDHHHHDHDHHDHHDDDDHHHHDHDHHDHHDHDDDDHHHDHDHDHDDDDDDDGPKKAYVKMTAKDLSMTVDLTVDLEAPPDHE